MYKPQNINHYILLFNYINVLQSALIILCAPECIKLFSIALIRSGAHQPMYVYDVLKHATYVLICISALWSALNHSNVDFKRVINNV